MLTILRILQQLWNAQGCGLTLSLETIANTTPQYDIQTVQTVLDLLKESAVVTQDENGN